MRWQRFVARIGLVLASLVFVTAVSIVLAGSFEKPNLNVGQPGFAADTFRLPDLDGRIVSLSTMRGDVVVLCFSPSPDTEQARQDAARLKDLATHYAGRPVRTLTVYSSTEDLTREQTNAIRSLALESGATTVTLLDPSSTISRRYGITQTPTFLIVDAAGTIRYRGGIDDTSKDAPMTAANFTSTIDLLLAERGGAGSQAETLLSKIK